ncbi:MAG TPA: dUTPase [Planctomycetota bacterium]|nr:dUTPase [Planctomycetota bacterium]
MPESDKLRDIFQLQGELNDGIFKKQDIRGPDGQVLTMSAIRSALEKNELGPNGLPNQWLRNYLRALQEESKELEQDLLWKWWSKDKIDMQNIRVEIVDLMHFLTSLALTAGLSADEFHRLYTAKHRVNQERQDKGYSKDNKDESDNKKIV